VTCPEPIRTLIPEAPALDLAGGWMPVDITLGLQYLEERKKFCEKARTDESIRPSFEKNYVAVVKDDIATVLAKKEGWQSAKKRLLRLESHKKVNSSVLSL